MKKLSLLSITLYSCITMSSYYDIDKQYNLKNTNAFCEPHSSLNIVYKEEKIENYLKTKKDKKSIRKKPAYAKID